MLSTLVVAVVSVAIEVTEPDADSVVASEAIVWVASTVLVVGSAVLTSELVVTSVMLSVAVVGSEVGSGIAVTVEVFSAAEDPVGLDASVGAGTEASVFDVDSVVAEVAFTEIVSMR